MQRRTGPFQQLRAGSIDHYQLEKRYFRRDGSLIWGRLSVSLLENTPPLIVAMVDDITEKKTAEEARFRHVAIVESSEDAIISKNLDAVIVSWNAGAQRIFGYTEEKAVGQPITLLIPPELRDEENMILERLRGGGRIEHYETVRVTKAGKRVDVSLSISSVKDSTGRIVGFTKIAHDITERKRAEDAVKESEQRFRLIADTAPVMIWMSGTDKLCTYFNKPWLDFTGRSIEEELGNGWAEGVHPDDLERCLDTYKQSFDRHEEFRMEYRLRRYDGEYRWILDIGMPRFNRDRSFAGYIGSCIDVTERKVAEDRLREYEAAVEGAEDIIGVVDREYRLLLANRQYLKMRNLTREKVVGHFVTEVLDKEIFETVIKPKLDECFQGKVVRYEMKFSYPTVGERDLLLTYFPIKGVNGVDRVACILHDITDRKRGEEALLEMNRTLEAQGALLRSREELLKVFVKNAPAGVAMFDRDMRYLQVSDRWCTDYSVDSSQILGRSHYELFPDLPQHWKEMHRRGLEGETLRAEDRWDRENGTKWVRWEIRPWFNIDSVPGGILIFAEDITHRKHSEEALSDMTGKLVEAQEQERVRIARELHDDINQRLALVAIGLDQLREKHKDLSSEVRGRVQELQQMTSDISSSVYALSHELYPSIPDSLVLARGMKSWCKEFGERQQMKIDFKGHDLPRLPQEISSCLFRVLQEAVHNAAKHSGVKRVEAQLQEESGEIHLIVSDSGRGFDVEVVSKGMGLGLIGMRERVRLVNGTISIESKPMGGTTIHACVPFESQQGAQRAAG